MTADFVRHPRLERLLARVLRSGTWLASGVIALGLALPVIDWPGISPALTGPRIITAGIALLIFLPVLRVVLMLIVFFREGDYRFGAIATLVLVIIVLGAALGMHEVGSLPG